MDFTNSAVTHQIYLFTCWYGVLGAHWIANDDDFANDVLDFWLDPHKGLDRDRKVNPRTHMVICLCLKIYNSAISDILAASLDFARTRN